MSQDILKHGEIIFVRILAGEQRNNQYRLFPLGMEPELASQMLPVLFEYVECGKLDAILGEIGNNLTSTLVLSGLEARENSGNCQLPLATIYNSVPLDASGVIKMGSQTDRMRDGMEGLRIMSQVSQFKTVSSEQIPHHLPS